MSNEMEAMKEDGQRDKRIESLENQVASLGCLLDELSEHVDRIAERGC